MNRPERATPAGRLRASRLVTALVVALVLAGCGTIPPGAGAPTPRGSDSPGRPPSSGPASPSGPVSPSGPASPSGPTGTADPGGGGTSGPAAVEQLPRGGTTIFPRYRLVGYVGYPGSSALGRLGTGDLDERVEEVLSRADDYTGTGVDGRRPMPVLELIAATVQSTPGADGRWRHRTAPAVIDRYLAAARRHRALLLLDIQPGRSDFPTEVAALRPWLDQPDVGLALDPEWRMHPGQVPGRAFGWVTGSELDAVGAAVSRLVREDRLPQKVVVYHQVAASVVRDEGALRDRPGVAWVKSVDGIGSRAQKISTYRLVNRTTPSFVAPGFKLFFDEDRRGGSALMTTRQVLALRPRPAYVMYE